MELFKSLIAGAVCGVVFSLAGLPIPAPPVFSGVVGIIGVFVGYKIILQFK
jgi:XapX domain-containing protein